LQKKIADMAAAVANKLDEYGINCGTLGFDIGLDQMGRLWLIEINNRDPDPGIALDIHNTQLYYALKTGPLFYAKYLAGFAAE
jgi:carbamoylphosphate synthase large subunit